MGNILTTLLTSSVVGTILGAIFNRINSEKSAIHNESEWRNDLYQLSKKTIIMRYDVELFRTCLSSTRGIENQNYKLNFDIRTAERYPELDDICLFYYHYLCDNNGKFDYINYDKVKENNNYNNFYSKNIVNEYSYLRNENEAIVFRQLCRMLLKSDWEHRNVKNSLLSKISCVTKINETSKKAANLIYSLENDKNHSNLIKNNADNYEKSYFNMILNNKEIISINISKILFILSLLLIFLCLIFPYNLLKVVNVFQSGNLDNFISNEKRFFMFPLLISLFIYISRKIIRFLIDDDYCYLLFSFGIYFFCFFNKNISSLYLIIFISIVFLYHIDNFLSKVFGLKKINMSYDFVSYKK